MENLQVLMEDKRVIEVNYEKKDMKQDEKIMDWESAKDKICMRVIGPKQEADLKYNALIVKFLNLSIVLYIKEENSTNKILVVTKNDVRSWRLPVEQIVQKALNNTGDKNSFVLKNMMGVLCNLIPDSINKEVKAEFLLETEKNPMYVLSTMSGRYGASSILFSDIFQKVCDDLECNLFILPSSVHELILVPQYPDGWCAEDLVQMVKEVNRTVVEAENLLADSVYYFDRKVGKVAIAAQQEIVYGKINETQ